MSRSPCRALAFLLICAWPGFALADCADYGATAAAQQKENIALGCGYSGLRWHGDAVGHAGFCNLVGEGTASGETARREVDLAKCRPAATIEQEETTGSGECRRSEIAEGKGVGSANARSAAHDMLGRARAEMINDGLTKCLFHDLGCSGPNNDRTCWMSVGCCAQ